MTVDEVTAAEITANADASATEIADAIVANGDKLNGKPLSATDALIAKIVEVAEREGVTCTGLNIGKHEAFTHEDRVRVTPQIIERAERQRVVMTEETLDKAKAQTIYPIKKRADGKWWIGEGESEMGPYDTKKEAEEDRRGVLRSKRLKDSEIVTSKEDRDAAKAKQAGKKAGGKKKTKGSEPSPLDGAPASSDDTNEPVNTTTSESEAEMSESNPTKSKKKAKGTGTKAAGKANKPAKAGKPKSDKAAKASKPAKAAKPAKEPKEKKVGALDAAVQVLKGRTNPMTCQELIDVMAERKLWSSPGGKTPAQTLSAAINREIANKGAESRFTKPEAGKYLAS